MTDRVIPLPRPGDPRIPAAPLAASTGATDEGFGAAVGGLAALGGALWDRQERKWAEEGATDARDLLGRGEFTPRPDDSSSYGAAYNRTLVSGHAALAITDAQAGIWSAFNDHQGDPEGFLAAVEEKTTGWVGPLADFDPVAGAELEGRIQSAWQPMYQRLAAEAARDAEQEARLRVDDLLAQDATIARNMAPSFWDEDPTIVAGAAQSFENMFALTRLGLRAQGLSEAEVATEMREQRRAASKAVLWAGLHSPEHRIAVVRALQDGEPVRFGDYDVLAEVTHEDRYRLMEMGLRLASLAAADQGGDAGARASEQEENQILQQAYSLKTPVTEDYLDYIAEHVSGTTYRALRKFYDDEGKFESNPDTALLLPIFKQAVGLEDGDLGGIPGFGATPSQVARQASFMASLFEIWDGVHEQMGTAARLADYEAAAMPLVSQYVVEFMTIDETTRAKFPPEMQSEWDRFVIEVEFPDGEIRNVPHMGAILDHLRRYPQSAEMDSQFLNRLGARFEAWRSWDARYGKQLKSRALAARAAAGEAAVTAAALLRVQREEQSREVVAETLDRLRAETPLLEQTGRDVRKLISRNLNAAFPDAGGDLVSWELSELGREFPLPSAALEALGGVPRFVAGAPASEHDYRQAAVWQLRRELLEPDSPWRATMEAVVRGEDDLAVDDPEGAVIEALSPEEIDGLVDRYIDRSTRAWSAIIEGRHPVVRAAPLVAAEFRRPAGIVEGAEDVMGAQLGLSEKWQSYMFPPTYDLTSRSADIVIDNLVSRGASLEQIQEDMWKLQATQDAMSEAEKYPDAVQLWEETSKIQWPPRQLTSEESDALADRLRKEGASLELIHEAGRDRERFAYAHPDTYYSTPFDEIFALQKLERMYGRDWQRLLSITVRRRIRDREEAAAEGASEEAASAARREQGVVAP